MEEPSHGWRAAVHGVAQSQTRLKRLSSSSSRDYCTEECLMNHETQAPRWLPGAAQRTQQNVIREESSQTATTSMIKNQCQIHQYSHIRKCVSPPILTHLIHPSSLELERIEIYIKWSHVFHGILHFLCYKSVVIFIFNKK